MFALGRPSGELSGRVGGRAGGLQARPWSQVRDYFYSSAHGTWPGVNDAICHPHPSALILAGPKGHCGALGRGGGGGGVGILFWDGVGLPRSPSCGAEAM